MLGLLRRIAVPLLVWASAAAVFLADLYTGLQIRWTNDWHDRGVGDQLDPQGILGAEIGRLVRLAQCVHAALFRSGGCRGQTRQFEQDPRALVHFGQAESDFRPFGLDLDLGAGTHGALVAADLEFLAIASERDGRLRRTTGEQGRTLSLDEGRVRRIRAERGEQR